MAEEALRYYWDYDRKALLADTGIWVEWLRERISRHVLFGLKRLLGQMDPDREVGWVLIYGHTLFGAVEGLSSFAYRQGKDREKFINFCNEFFLPKRTLSPDLAEAMYVNFRCGLAHGFGIEKGGLTFKEDLGSLDPITRKDNCYWLDPAWLLHRLEAACAEFLRRAGSPGSLEALSFEARFRQILDRTCLQPPPKSI